ncbi:putative ABC transporter ATP-binding/permease protein [Vibrio stylophorae]|uniref:ABC transporter ATP-binding/permease protein n=1 Tax=Vibrio stylophorae TaxID=659351 RepID=A0ABN8DUS8_9VIBR|nr:cysteine/glutathione ABC transporter ATP-binding protein/permease CydC [Vibrio stylophorae]CAH0533112.1 putative ABC transporter ATP-binding/permease protein [Vibrio stylophorae]
MRDLMPFLRLYRYHWFELSLGMVLALATVCAAVGLLSLSGWFISAAAVAGLSPLASQFFNYMLPAGGVRGLSMARTAGRWGERVVSHNATFKLLTRLRVYFFEKLAPLIPGTLGDLRDADILNRLISDVDAMDQVYLRLVSPMVVGVLAILATSGLIAFFDPALALILGACLTALLLILPVIFYRLGKAPSSALADQKMAIRVRLMDWLQGHAELVLFGGEARYRQALNQEQRVLFSAQHRMAHLTGLASALLLLCGGTLLVLMLWLAADGVGGHEQNPLIALVAFSTLGAMEILMPVAGAFHFLGQTQTAAKRLNAILNAKPDVDFSQSQFTGPCQGAIAFDAVNYRYNAQQPWVLSQCTLSLKAGEKAAILGQTGCGKSTLLKLLTRQYDPQQGQITIDGIALDQWQESALRQAITVVSQRVDLLNDTLRDNLRLAKPEATDAQLQQALEQVELGYLGETEQKMNLWLGEGGRQLSGGERRRIGIARAILHNAPILLLDEPTEGLDRRTEQQILKLLQAHWQGKTVLYITHRLVGLAQMDQVHVMEQGQFAESGSHQALLDAKGRYWQLWQQIG